MEKALEEIRQREKLAYVSDDVKRVTAYNVVKELVNMLDFKSVLDVGCGTCVYKPHFEWFNKKYKGFDGNVDAKPPIVADLRMQLDFGLHDLVFCIEVAEHIEKEYEKVFIDNLVKHTQKWIVMTACPPKKGQMSEYRKAAHFNEQYPPYWIQKFQELGFTYCENMSAELRYRYSQIDQMKSWFKYNLLIFRYDLSQETTKKSSKQKTSSR